MPPYRALISVTDAPTVSGLTGFVKPAAAIIQPGTTTAIAIPEDDPTDDGFRFIGSYSNCLLYTSDAADERSSVDLGGRRIIKKKKKKKKRRSRRQEKTRRVWMKTCE